MPRYFFDLEDSHGIAIDEEGLILRDLDDARSEAARALSNMLQNAVLSVSGNSIDKMKIAIRNDDRLVMIVRFAFEIGSKEQN
ncbi:DUF6894 family protein [Bradyrhizobium jicamae]|uniref:DUF6894 family protein n=1 Tax=Bradyrhizobium jicamae TaxID=280332 RepID=UPI001BAC6E2D|nr:hypothetical protein [Bradyrhizobium jicamae]MBR0939402.1 hypothetical protein [Bradyrhizobium jicamae]